MNEEPLTSIQEYSLKLFKDEHGRDAYICPSTGVQRVYKHVEGAWYCRWKILNGKVDINSITKHGDVPQDVLNKLV